MVVRFDRECFVARLRFATAKMPSLSQNARCLESLRLWWANLRQDKGGKSPT